MAPIKWSNELQPELLIPSRLEQPFLRIPSRSVSALTSRQQVLSREAWSSADYQAERVPFEPVIDRLRPIHRRVRGVEWEVKSPTPRFRSPRH